MIPDSCRDATCRVSTTPYFLLLTPYFLLITQSFPYAKMGMIDKLKGSFF
ncbi:hypothetical protein [Mastigocoleus sp. MO_188.B34]|nr:hypothetical protein [Mastigocoleus sp. MO_188.B34]MDJ0693181.1 hypothetical protein [Mastigocoleus sp. MO_188.B34]